MRIANIIEEGKLGGPQMRMMHVAHALKDQVRTTIIMPSENSTEFQRRCDMLSIPYKTLWMSRITKEWKVALRYLFFSFFEIGRLIIFLRRGGYDVVHVSGGSWQYKGVIAGKLAGRKVLWHINDTFMPSFIHRIFKVMSRFADGYIFASERSREYYASLVQANKSAFVIPAPVDTEVFKPSRDFSGDEELIGKWAGKTVVGTTANVNPIKGLDTLVRVAASLNERFEKLIFVVIGVVHDNQRSYFDKLRHLCTELGVANIEFVGGRSDVRPIMKRVDVYLCTSIAESSPLAVWEAMAMAKPVISTDVGDVPVYVKSGINGYIAPVRDWAALADGVAAVIRRKEAGKTLGCNARQIAMEELDLAICAQRHAAAYARIFAS